MPDIGSGHITFSFPIYVSYEDLAIMKVIWACGAITQVYCRTYYLETTKDNVMIFLGISGLA